MSVSSVSERERQLTQRVSDVEGELAATRRMYYAMENERDAVLKEKNKEVARLNGVVARLKGEVGVEAAEVERLRREVERLRPNVPGPSSKQKAEMLLARLNGNV